MTEQKVAGTDAQVDETGKKVEGAPGTDQLLEQFDKGTEPILREIREGQKKVEARLDADDKATAKIKLDADVDIAVAKIKENSAASDEEIKRLIYGEAAVNDDFNKAFEDRAKDPGAWDAAVTKLTESIAPTDKVARDIESVNAAVRGAASTSPGDFPADADVMRMNDADFNKFQREQGIKPVL